MDMVTKSVYSSSMQLICRLLQQISLPLYVCVCKWGRVLSGFLVKNFLKSIKCIVMQIFYCYANFHIVLDQKISPVESFLGRSYAVLGRGTPFPT